MHLQRYIDGEFEGHRIDVLTYQDRRCWLASQVSLAWGYSRADRLSGMIRKWEKQYPEQFRPHGVDFLKLEGEALQQLRAVLESGNTQQVFLNPAHELLLFESGMQACLLKTHKPAGARFVNWCKDELFPATKHYAETGDTSQLDAALRQDDDGLDALEKIAIQNLDFIRQVRKLSHRQDDLEIRQRYAQEQHEKEMALIQAEQIKLREEQQHVLAHIETLPPHYLSALAFVRLSKIGNPEAPQLIGARATKICREQNIKKYEIPDPRYGTVGVYPKDVLHRAANELGFL